MITDLVCILSDVNLIDLGLNYLFLKQPVFVQVFLFFLMVESITTNNYYKKTLASVKKKRLYITTNNKMHVHYCAEKNLGANTINSDRTFIGFPLVIACVMLPLQTLLCVFALYNLCRLSPKVNRLFVWSAIVYHISSWLCVLHIFTGAVIARFDPSLMEWFAFCPWSVSLIFLTAILLYLSSVVFWFQRLGLQKYVYVYIYTYTNALLVFKNSVERVNKTAIRVLYGFLLIFAIALGGGSFVIGMRSNCIHSVAALDFNVAGRTTYYACFIDTSSALIITVCGGIVVFILNCVIAYLYITRMMKISKKIDHPPRLRIQSVPSKGIIIVQTDDNNATANNTNANKSKVFETNENFAHIRKSTQIAIASSSSTLLTFIILVIGRGGTFLIEIDVFLNGILICCVFLFGNNIYLMLFRCKLLRILSHSNDVSVSPQLSNLSNNDLVIVPIFENNKKRDVTFSR
ncbi:hypothetical protein RFI_10398 [Reticulomyxa filosa]|uniref:Uncharacterized protein n=1 Tax=Reticulomyxa filosa TaxID=46433 RepID=X6NL65_RETFI|nr:hypothetical protein RFI_10398 [Reticulomyxa filosa]|eukprot:ETO26736.1 hypothetical protein RFI_10398 [Reticulomyxa filosa]